jgi:hypothetical protein
MLIGVRHDYHLRNREFLTSQRRNVDRRDSECCRLLQSLAKGSNRGFGNETKATRVARRSAHFTNQAVPLPGECDRDAGVRSIETFGHVDDNWSIALRQFGVGKLND